MSHVVGIGIDVVNIDRFQESVNRTPNLITRLFTENEASLSIGSIAARFAAKEALTKALNIKTLNWREIEVLNEESGKPYFKFHGKLAKEFENKLTHLTLSHDSGIASAMVIVEKK
jgi:holo-[acyl-carrier protein] synthase